LSIYDNTGKFIKDLINKRQNAGTYEVIFDAEGLSSGIYLYRLQTDKSSITKKLIYIK
jgi:hypothetical protein